MKLTLWKLTPAQEKAFSELLEIARKIKAGVPLHKIEFKVEPKTGKQKTLKP